MKNTIKGIRVICLVAFLLGAFPLTAYAYESITMVEEATRAFLGLIIAGGIFRMTYVAVRMLYAGEPLQTVIHKTLHYIAFMILAITFAAMIRIIMRYY
ncbi:MAG: hypothetical protein KH230_09710 [Enterocloster asparagiformis]|nr:hypothetical protein [Enterocloster asparagiformis]